ncbi:Zn(II)2Cys6 transcription factor [Aspergillus indologenus CBS 114.80]|uniref:Zn(II)2Cys6 transcription factor n=1 Tax=Aspergillus indologenus CBS 114.80 TaxID=1450541 RepID=A0A2V5IG18_9EURO|nr:Zn(II)2Cys6 transcription factor [Aspergillus indologenus CBS 114.80]
MDPSPLARRRNRQAAPRSRTTTACARCQKRKIRCDGVVPVCGGCQRARVDCVEGWNVRDISRSHVEELEARIGWLESIIQEHLPHIDLSRSDSDYSVRPRTSDYGVPTDLATSETVVSQTAHTRDGWNPARDVTDQLGLVSVNAGADLRYLGPSSGLFFTRFVLTGLERRAKITRESPPVLKSNQSVPVELLDLQPKDLPSDLKQAQWLTQAYFEAIAIVHLDAIFQKSSLRGLMGLHYNSLAAVMELGLHRNVRDSVFTDFDQEMRTRAFRCVYTTDRYLSTLLGRSIGIVDEQCDLRLPREINDEDLKPNQEIPAQAQPSGAITVMSSAIHLFKLARFNAEIKCVLYRVDRNYPPYTQPVITDVKRWQEDMLNRLRQWKSSIPCHPPGSSACYLNDLLDIKYRELVMLIVRPSPLFNHPSRSLIRLCFHCALECIRLYHKLYINSMLHYNWMNVQSLFLCVMTIFYCVWAPDGVGEETDLDTVLHALKSASDILSASGEYWLEAKRSRDVPDGITRATVRRFARSLARAGQPSASRPGVETHRSPDYQDTSGMNSLDTRAYATGTGNAGQVSFDPYYVPTQQPTATSELLSFFAGPQSEMTLDWLSFPWDAPGGLGEIMHDLVSWEPVG